MPAEQAKSNAVEAAEQTLRDLEAKRAACVQRGTDLADERANVAFAAHTGNDAKAAKRLEEIHKAIVVHSSELASLDAALKAAAAKLEAARAAEAREADKENALALREQLKEFLACDESLNEALEALAEEGALLHEAAARMRTLGCHFPTAPTSYRARPFDPASFVPVPFDLRLSADWWQVQEEGRVMRD